MCDNSMVVSYLHVALLRYRLRMSIKLRSSLLLMVQFRKEQSVETFNMKTNFFPLWASRFTRLLGPLSSRTCDCSQKKVFPVSLLIGICWYWFFTGEYWREKERLDVSISQAINAVQIFGVNLRSPELVTVGRVTKCPWFLLLSPLIIAWVLCSLIQAFGQTGVCLLTAQPGLSLIRGARVSLLCFRPSLARWAVRERS